MTEPTKVTIKKGDTLPYLAATLGGGPTDWTGATAEIGIRRWCTTDDWVRYPATFFTPATKEVQWDYAGFDTDVAGTYEYEWIVTFTGGEEMTAPPDTYDLLIIVDPSA